jgi:hypothetical protein
MHAKQIHVSAYMVDYGYLYIAVYPENGRANMNTPGSASQGSKRRQEEPWRKNRSHTK